MTKLNVVELFAGVGGFRLGLDSNKYNIVWSNQWEPSSKFQHASEIYKARFGDKDHSSEDIETVPTSDIPAHDLLVGGFPCQDYSVATTLKNSKGLIGKKGVLWWSIHRILTEKKRKPHYLMLENVDRLLKSPANQRGRDFAVMLQSLSELGYVLEWRVINAAEYGMPQRRRRVFMLGYHKNSSVYKKFKKSTPESWIEKEGVVAKAFPINKDALFPDEFELHGSLEQVSKNFNITGSSTSPFLNTGVMIDSKVYTIKTNPVYKGKEKPLRDILVDEKNVEEEFYVNNKDLKKWKYLKNSKQEERETKDGFKYNYSEGSMIFPDDLDKASRTIITGEGGSGPSRFKHVIAPPSNPKKLRRLTPIELERLNMFPDDHTKLENVSNTKRAFLMGNALVVGVIKKLGDSLYNFYE